MEKEINIDEILDKACLKELGVPYEDTIYFDNDKYTKLIIKEILTETLQMCADEAEVNVKGYNNYEVDKDSITSLINKIKF